MPCGIVREYSHGVRGMGQGWGWGRGWGGAGRRGGTLVTESTLPSKLKISGFSLPSSRVTRLNWITPDTLRVMEDLGVDGALLGGGAGHRGAGGGGRRREVVVAVGFGSGIAVVLTTATNCLKDMYCKKSKLSGSFVISVTILPVLSNSILP